MEMDCCVPLTAAPTSCDIYLGPFNGAPGRINRHTIFVAGQHINQISFQPLTARFVLASVWKYPL